MIQSGLRILVMTWEGGRAGINKNVTNAGSQLTWEGGRAEINKNVSNAGSQLTFQMFRLIYCHNNCRFHRLHSDDRGAFTPLYIILCVMESR